MSLIDSQDEILALVKTIPHIGVYDDELPDEVIPETIPGTDQIRPFVTISFGGLVEAPRRVNGIAGADKDTGETTIVIQGVGSTPRAAKAVVELVRKKLVGYKPANCGEIRFALFGGTGKLSHLGNPTRYGSNQSLRYYQNSDTAGA
jgi:hypothetical protein